MLHLNLIGLGAELGYWQSLCNGPLTADELGRRTKCNVRYTKEGCLAMASGGLLSVIEAGQAKAKFAVKQRIQSAVQDTAQLVSACDVSAVTQDRGQLLELCRQGGGPVVASWSALCQQPLGVTNAAGWLFDTASPAAFWRSLSQSAAAVRHTYLIGIGAELGYWESLCKGRVKSSELAKHTKCTLSYTDSWCIAMAAAGVLERDATSFAVPQKVCSALMRKDELMISGDFGVIEHRSQLRQVRATSRMPRCCPRMPP